MTSLDEDKIKKHVQDKDTWLRFVYLVVFGFAFYLSIILTFATSIFQFLAKLFGGQSFEGLSDFGDNLATYQSEVTRFLTFSSDVKPFPFAPFPGSDADYAMPSAPTPKPEAKPETEEEKPQEKQEDTPFSSDTPA